MRTDDIRALAVGLEELAQSGLAADACEVIQALRLALDRFADVPTDQLLAALSALKPRRRTSGAVKSAADVEVVDAYARELSIRLGDHKRLIELMARLRADKSVRKLEALALARRAGVKTNSKTTKELALQQIEGLSSSRVRDQELAERIRRGA